MSKMDMTRASDKIERSLYMPGEHLSTGKRKIICERAMDMTWLTLSGDSGIPFVTITLDAEGHFNLEVDQSQL